VSRPPEPSASPDLVDAIERSGARVLLVNAAGRVLLFRGHDPERPDGGSYWFTVGGGLDPGETAAEGATRELYEETGLLVRPDELGKPVFHEVAVFPFCGRWHRQEQDFFALRVTDWEVAPTYLSDDERISLTGHRWWSLAEIECAGEPVYPAELADLLRGLGVR
jgi:8-oxo-dGTP pyrophosphatase MutT (NUDIX family)